MKKKIVDTPYKGSWADTVNKEPLHKPKSFWNNETALDTKKTK